MLEMDGNNKKKKDNTTLFVVYKGKHLDDILYIRKSIDYFV